MYNQRKRILWKILSWNFFAVTSNRWTPMTNYFRVLTYRFLYKHLTNFLSPDVETVTAFLFFFGTTSTSFLFHKALVTGIYIDSPSATVRCYHSKRCSVPMSCLLFRKQCSERLHDRYKWKSPGQDTPKSILGVSAVLGKVSEEVLGDFRRWGGVFPPSEWIIRGRISEKSIGWRRGGL